MGQEKVGRNRLYSEKVEPPPRPGKWKLMGVSRNSGLWGERAGMILRKFRSTASFFFNQNANYSSAFTEYCHLYRINILRYILSCT